MSYLVIARKFRPQTFAQVCGQEHVTRTLANSIRRQRIAHAYLFAGPRGVGKTSIARIFAKALNCKEGPTTEPCGKCSNCSEIAQGTNLAVREIDGASHNSVDNVRDLIESFRALPPPGSRYKIYIIDEVHMFSTAAFNALLKSLEEPPPNTVFILATTEAHKIPETVISRCQRHDFRALGQRDVEQSLFAIAETEGMQAEPEALRMIARLSEGSMRDAQSLLERVNAFCDGAISAANASVVLGTVERTILSRLSQAVLSRDAAQALGLVGEVFTKGVDPGLFLREFAAHFRELLIAKFAGERGLSALGVSEGDRVELLRQAGTVSEHDIQDLVHLARQGCDEALRSAYPKYALESLVVRMATREPVIEIAEMLASVRQQQVAVPAAGKTAPPMAPRAAPGAEPQSSGASAPRANVSAGDSPRPPSPPPQASPTSKGSGAAQSSEASLDWAAFVRRATELGHRMVAEHLKRLGVREFIVREGLGLLEGSGPEFTITSLQNSDNKKKLEASLAEFSGTNRWQIKLSAAASGSEAVNASLVQQEEATARRVHVEKKADISNHPKIKSLQKLFPGTEIETIKVKGE